MLRDLSEARRQVGADHRTVVGQTELQLHTHAVAAFGNARAAVPELAAVEQPRMLRQLRVPLGGDARLHLGVDAPRMRGQEPQLDGLARQAGVAVDGELVLVEVGRRNH
eukprot:scaffold40271_cov63-Phaeocystis_antarctica.AAC.1